MDLHIAAHQPQPVLDDQQAVCKLGIFEDRFSVESLCPGR